MTRQYRQVKYDRTKTRLLTTKCKVTGYLIGGGQCVNCEHYYGKDMHRQIVKCSCSMTAMRGAKE